MASIKNLAGQTMWYGVSTIAAQMINFLQNPILTYLLDDSKGRANFGELALLYSLIPFANAVFTYGRATSYFRFSSNTVDKERLFQTSFGSLLISTVLLGFTLWFFRLPLASFTALTAHPEYVTWAIIIIGLDALTTIPFARLRQEGRPRKFAFIRLGGIIINLTSVILLVGLAPRWVAAHPHSFFAGWYHQYTATGFVLLANVIQNIFVFLALYREWSIFRFRIDGALLRSILAYSLPFVIIGLGGVINETLDRKLLQQYYSGTVTQAKEAVGIYNSNYKLAIIITLFIRAFQMAAEPFFFSQSADRNAPKTYARVMKWFVITVCFAFLATVLFLDIWKYIEGPSYRVGLGVVPILLLANVALGIYYNLAIWYKLTAKLYWGIGITLFGAALTIFINVTFIPHYGMWACAWATFICYTSMMIISYIAGQKYFPVPYATKKLVSYLGVIIVLFLLQRGMYTLTTSFLIRLISGGLFMLAFVGLVWRVERTELKSFPVIGRFIR
jgi:O-antigen/teichoic acid export membrane protein